MKSILLILFMLFPLAAGTSFSSDQEPSTGSISGVVWHDTNLDGTRQPDEPGLQISFALVPTGPNVPPNGHQTAGTQSNQDGTYKFEGLAAGSYTIKVSNAGQPFIGTYPAKVFGREISQAVTVVADRATSANLGLVTNFARATGTAWVDAAQPNQPIVAAFVNGRQCAFMPEVPYPVSHTGPGYFQMYFLPEGLVPGCGTPGSTVRFTINGRMANESISYPDRPAAISLSTLVPRPPSTPEEIQPRVITNLTVGAPFAVYTGSLRGIDGSHLAPENIVARVDGTDCGILLFSFGGFSLSVVSKAQKDGCGYEGAKVDLYSAATYLTSAFWTPGFHHIDLIVAEESPNPSVVKTPGTPSVPQRSLVTPPDTGSAGLQK